MSAWIIYNKDGLAKCEARKLEYSGEFLGACSVNVSISSPSPIGFELGDWLEYRGERFELNYDPSVVKEASKGAYGEGFVYENVVFNSLSDELTRCDFLDVVPADNHIHYTSLPNFSFFAESVEALAERLQANLNRVYKGEKSWTVSVHPEFAGKTDINITISNQTCWDALALAKSEFEANFIIKGRHITIGTSGIAVGNLFSYGKGNGLFKIEKNAESDQKIVTRLRAYGSTRNLPTHYYQNLEGGNVPNNMAVKHLMLPSFPLETLDPYIDSKNIESLGVRESTVFFDGSNGLDEIYPTMEGMTAEDLKDAGVNVSATGALDVIVTAEQMTDNGIIPEGGELKGNFKVTLKDIGFDINEHLSTSGSATLAMKSGMCSGREFEIEACVKTTGGYELTCKRTEDSGLGLVFPYKDFQIKANDKFVLLNIEMPDVYIKAASQRLLSAAKDYLAKNDYVRYSYTPTLDNIFLARQHDEAVANGGVSIHDTIKEGDFILFEDEDLGISGSVTIDSLSIKEDYSESIIPEYSLTLRNEKSVGTIEKIQNQVTSILNGVSGGSVNTEQVKSIVEAVGGVRFLSKTKDDTAKGVITFEKGIRSKDFVRGNLFGAGWSIYKDANDNTVVETDTVIARKGIHASELVVNQETFEKGSNIFVKGGCTIVKVEEVDGKYRCFYDNENGKRFSGFKVGDQARCQRYDSSYWLKIKYYWRLVVGVADDYVELSMTDFDGDGVPEEGDDIAQLGNRTDKTRQSAIVISPDNGGSVVVWAGIDSYNLSERNMCGMGVNPNSGRAYIYGYGDMFFGDRNLEKNFITYQIKDGDTEPTLTINADVHLSKDSTGLGNLTEFEEIKTNVDYLNNQIEREFTIWYFDDEPTLENEPAVNWVTDELKAIHDQDLYFSDALARAWRFVNGNWVEVTDERTLAALKLADEAQKAATEAKDYINNVLPRQLEGLQNQIDGTIESHFYKYDPSLDNYPANEWITEEQKEAHLNDTFTNLESGYSWRWTKEIIPSEEEGVEPSVLYKWIEIADTATVKALVAAGKAQDTADGKRRVFVETPFTPYNVCDLWVQGEAGDIMRCAVERLRGEYAESDWVKASKYTDDSALETFLNGAYKNQLEVIQKQIDSRSETWYQVKDPSLSWDTDELKQLHIGDLWYSINDKQSFMWTGAEWIVQGVPDEVFDKIDGKAEIFVSKPTKYNRNDLWFLGEDITLDKAYKAGVIVVATAKSNVFNPLHWTKFDKYTDDTLAQEALKKAESFSDDLSGVLADMEIVKGQVDREFTVWYYDAEPTLYNEPAVNWNTQALIEMHDQDIYFSDSLARAWRFVEGRWVEITDERTLAVLNKVSDLEFIKEAFGENVTQGGVIISNLVGVQNSDGEIEAFLNGGEFAKDESHGKLIMASGIPSAGGTLDKRSAEALTRLYEDGTLYAQKGIFGGFLRSTLADVKACDAVQVEPKYNDRAWKLKDVLYVDGTFEEIVLPCGDEYAGARAIVMDTYFIKSRTARYPTIIRTEDGSQIFSGLLYNIDTHREYGASVIQIDCGSIELIYKYVENEYGILNRSWVVVSHSCATFKDYNEA